MLGEDAALAFALQLSSQDASDASASRCTPPTATLSVPPSAKSHASVSVAGGGIKVGLANGEGLSSWALRQLDRLLADDAAMDGRSHTYSIVPMPMPMSIPMPMPMPMPMCMRDGP